MVRILHIVLTILSNLSPRWVNRKDSTGSNVFEGGFLGLDNIGAFNRSEPLPTGGSLRQADGTAWMAFYCLNMYVLRLAEPAVLLTIFLG